MNLRTYQNKKDLNIQVINEDKKIKFKNNLPIDRLIKTLTKYQIDKLLIEEATLKDIFTLLQIGGNSLREK